MRLSARAKARRETLGISMAECADHIGVGNHRFRQWETCLIKKPKLANELRWEEVLDVAPGWLRDESVATNRANIHKGLSLEQCQSVAEEIWTVSVWLSRTKSSKRTMDMDALSAQERRNAAIFAQRYGVKGHKASTLQQVADDYGLTRQRIQQLCERTVERAVGLQAPSSAVEKLRVALQDVLPATIEHIDAEFRELLGESLSVIDAQRFAAELLGKSLIHLTRNPGGALATRVKAALAPNGDSERDARQLKAVRAVAMRMIASVGAGHVATVAGYASDDLGTGLTASETESYCKLVPGFSWLSHEHGWFWFGDESPGSNRLLSATRKILTVANGRVDIDTIYHGFIRSRRHISHKRDARKILIEPPVAVAAEALRQTPWLSSIQYDDFVLNDDAYHDQPDDEAEWQLVSAMQETGGIAARRVLLHRFVHGQGMNHMTFQVALEKSPVLVKLEKGLYALRGRSLTADALLKAMSERGGIRKNAEISEEDVAQLTSGWLSFESEIGELALRDGALRLPNVIARQIEDGEYVEPESKIISRIVTIPSGGDTFLRGLLRFLDVDWQLGQAIRVHLHPAGKQVRVDVN